MRSLFRMCFDRRVLATLGVVGVLIWLLAPQWIMAALPILLLLACPLSMLLMARTMADATDGSAPQVADDGFSAADRLAALEREQARLSAEIARARQELVTPARAANQAERSVARQSYDAE